MGDRGSRMEDRGSRIEDGGWRIEDGGSRIEDGGSRREDGGRPALIDSWHAGEGFVGRPTTLWRIRLDRAPHPVDAEFFLDRTPWMARATDAQAELAVVIGTHAPPRVPRRYCGPGAKWVSELAAIRVQGQGGQKRPRARMAHESFLARGFAPCGEGTGARRGGFGGRPGHYPTVPTIRKRWWVSSCGRHAELWRAGLPRAMSPTGHQRTDLSEDPRHPTAPCLCLKKSRLLLDSASEVG
jgi:hypothetical protein